MYAVWFANNEISELPVVTFVSMVDAGAACKVGISCPACAKVTVAHEPPLVDIHSTRAT